MKLLSTPAAAVLVAVASSASAFQGVPISARPRSKMTTLNMVYSNYTGDVISRGLPNEDIPYMPSSSSSSSSSVYQQKRPRLDWKHALAEAATTFSEFRELEAAGLLDESEAVEAAKRKAAASFAAFAKTAQKELMVTNAAASFSFAPQQQQQRAATSAPPVQQQQQQQPVEPSHAWERALVQAAAALGKRTGQIFGGVLPENYRD